MKMKVDLAKIIDNKYGKLNRLKIHLKKYDLDHYLKIKLVTKKVICMPYSKKISVCKLSLDEIRELVLLYYSHPKVPLTPSDMNPTMLLLKEYIEKLNNK